MTDPLRGEIYRLPRAHEIERPRHGDLAEIKRDHCQPETGLVVQVVGDPHLAVARCHKCGQRIEEYLVEIFCNNPAWMKTPGPWFYPVDWLKRIDPRDPLQYERVRQYRQVLATAEQWIEASA